MHNEIIKSLIIQWWQHYLFCSPSSYVATSSCLLDKKLNQNYLEPSLVHCRDNVAQHLKALLAPFQMCPTRHSYWSSLGVAVTFSKVGFMSHHIFRSTCTCTLKWVLWHTLLLHMLHNATWVLCATSSLGRTLSGRSSNSISELKNETFQDLDQIPNYPHWTVLSSVMWLVSTEQAQQWEVFCCCQILGSF